MVFFARTGHAQPVESGGGFKFVEYYPAPNETRMKSMLEGAQAQGQPDGRMLITQAKWQTFRLDGERELAAEAPQCFYDQSRQTISSPGSLQVQIANGRFSIAGEGFLYQQTNSILLVSNRVHTILHPELLAQQSATTPANVPAKTAPGIDIFSDRFDYAEESGHGVYQGHVHVTGTNLTATAGRLTIVLPMAERRLQTLTAEQDVIIDYEKIHATGARAFYSADTDLIRLTGQPTWRMEQRDGSGDELVFDRTNRVFRASGHARLQMPAQTMGSAGFLSGTVTNSAAPVPLTNQFVEVLCDNYELQTNLAVFHEHVRVSDRLGEQLRGQMTCGLMTLTFTGTNELQKMVAEHDVVIAQEDKQFTAARADYTGANGLMDLTGNPAWRAGPREGKGDWIRVNLARQEMLVRGNAFMRLPAAELGQSAIASLGTAQGGRSKGKTNEFAEAFSREYLLTPEAALFRGNVRIVHPQMKWTCDELTLLTPPGLGKEGHMLIAEPAVVFDVVDDQGQSFHGTGRKAVYTRYSTATLTNNILELTGSPAVLETTNIIGRNNIITLDLGTHTIVAPGKYKIVGTLPPGQTNLFRPHGEGASGHHPHSVPGISLSPLAGRGPGSTAVELSGSSRAVASSPSPPLEERVGERRPFARGPLNSTAVGPGRGVRPLEDQRIVLASEHGASSPRPSPPEEEREPYQSPGGSGKIRPSGNQGGNGQAIQPGT